MRLLIDGIDYGSDLDGVDSIKLTVNYNDDLILEYVSSTTIKAKGAAFDKLKQYWWGDDNFCKLGKKPMPCILIDLDCDLSINFEIRVGAVSICHEGCIDFVLTQAQPEEAAYLCLKNITNYTTAQGFNEWMAQRAIKFPYCNKLNVFTFLIWHFTVRPLLGAVYSVICPIINLFGGDCAEDIRDISREAARCNNYLTVPKLDDLISYNCKACGIMFNSSILQRSVYKDSVLIYQNGNPGPKINECNTVSGRWRPLDQLNNNILQIWDLLKPVFNSRVRIKNGVAELERKDYFDRYTEILLNVEDEYGKGKMDCPTYSHDTSKLYAYGRFQYTQDASDPRGDNNKSDYNDIIEWNPNKYEEVKGEYTLTVPFSPIANVKDRTNPGWVFERGTYLDNCRPVFHGFMEIGEDVFLNPKIGIVEKTNRLCDGCSFWKLKSEIKNKFGQLIYNSEYMFKDLTGPGEAKTDLYNNFHIIDSPEYGREFIKLDTFTWFPENFTESIKKVINFGLDLGIATKYGVAKPNSITISFAEKSIEIEPLNLRCK